MFKANPGENVSVPLVCIHLLLLIFFPIGEMECTKVDQVSKHDNSNLFSPEEKNLSKKTKKPDIHTERENVYTKSNKQVSKMHLNTEQSLSISS